MFFARKYRLSFIGLWLLVAATLAPALTLASTLTIYSGRGESYVRPLVQQFERNTGIQVQVRYGDTSALAVLLQEEGERTPADLYWSQDAGAMGVLAKAGLLTTLPASIFTDLAHRYFGRTQHWVATSGRARSLAYSSERTTPANHPQSVFDLVHAEFQGRVGLAPTNGSFQSFVTAMRIEHGDAQTLQWLRDLRANNAQAYRNNTTQLIAIAEGDIDYALVNHYYLPRFTLANSSFPVQQTFFAPGDVGNMMNVAAIAMLATSVNKNSALQFIDYVLAPETQHYFATVTHEYPVRSEMHGYTESNKGFELLTGAPQLDFDDLQDLSGTLQLLRQAGWL